MRAVVEVLPTPEVLRATLLLELEEEGVEAEGGAVGKAPSEEEVVETLVAGGARAWRERAGIARKPATPGSSATSGLRAGRLQAWRHHMGSALVEGLPREVAALTGRASPSPSLW